MQKSKNLKGWRFYKEKGSSNNHSETADIKAEISDILQVLFLSNMQNTIRRDMMDDIRQL